MLNKIKNYILLNVKNIPGWRTKRKILIIECDDWGSLRVPSRNIFNKLKSKGLKINTGWHNEFDALENKKDLEQLFETLTSVKDKNNNYAIMTPFVIMANPDFKKIKLSGYSEYFYEPFTVTLKRYHSDEKTINLYKQGLTSGIFVPELHGREHLTVQLWMDKLKQGNKDLLTAFDHEFTSLEIPDVPAWANEFRAEFYYTSEGQKPFLFKSIKEAKDLFYDIFGYLPRIFAPGNGIFHSDFDVEIAKAGIKFLLVNHASPYPVDGGKIKYRYFFPGQKGPEGITYYTRNCAFEPNDPSYKGIDFTLQQIAASFKWGKPANISSHRVNFVGGIDPLIRKTGLTELKKLLKAILRKWPDVEFMSSAELLNYMNNKNK